MTRSSADLINDLLVIHQGQPAQAKPSATEAQELDFTGSVLKVETCLRRFWVTTAEVLETHPQNALIVTQGLTLYRGPAAYLFLLRVCCGLESKMAGETEVFGQVKEAFRQYSLNASAAESKNLGRDALGSVMQKLFTDAKDIRSRYLRGLGSASYGSLVRKLIESKIDRGGSDPVRTLVMGAGQLAESVAPYLDKTALTLVNRNSERARVLASKLPFLVTVLDADLYAMQPPQYDVVVICTPLESPIHATHRSIYRDAKLVIHLGANRADVLAALPSAPCAELYALDDVFNLLQNDSQIREAQIARAAQACRTQSQLRAMGGSAGHGWEDLAEFA